MPDKKMRVSICRSTSLDPRVNLAIEEQLLDRVQADEMILYLWQNEKTVVIGRHQNAWQECRTEQLEADGGQLVRRLSGGGAVYHDLGNLNFTFVVDRKHYDLPKQLAVILGAVREFGIPAEFSGRNDLLAAGKKFSGNAFCFRGEGAYHHGTLLVDADFSRMSRYLQPSPEKINAKGIPSVQARVINLAELNPAVTVTTLAAALAGSFSRVYGGGTEIEQLDPGSFGLAELREKYASWEWTYGKSPSFDVSLAQRFAWGGIEIGLCLKNGLIETACVYSDAMDEAMISRITQKIQGQPLDKAILLPALGGLAENRAWRPFLEDLIGWLAEKEI